MFQKNHIRYILWMSFWTILICDLLTFPGCALIYFGKEENRNKNGKCTHLDVCHSMIVQIRTGCKSLAADLTLMWFLSGMYTTMCIQWARCTETFATHQTHMRFFTCFENKRWKKKKKTKIKYTFNCRFHWSNQNMKTKKWRKKKTSRTNRSRLDLQNGFSIVCRYRFPGINNRRIYIRKSNLFSHRHQTMRRWFDLKRAFNEWKVEIGNKNPFTRKKKQEQSDDLHLDHNIFFFYFCSSIYVALKQCRWKSISFLFFFYAPLSSSNFLF